jgi:hypothetical protein
MEGKEYKMDDVYWEKGSYALEAMRMRTFQIVIQTNYTSNSNLL